MLAPIPASLAAGLAAPFEAVVSTASDMDGAGRFGEAWVGADRERVVALHGARPALDLPLSTITEVRIDELFGASRLVAVCGGAEHVLATYSRNLVAEFALLARALDDLREGRDVQLPEVIERSVCASCGAPLPERGATCPRCLSRGSVVRRILGLLRPYRRRTVLLMLFAGAGVVASMIPPLTYKMIADRVLEGGRHEELLLWVTLMLAAFLLGSTFQLLTNWSNAWLGARVVADMRAQLHARAQRLKLDYHSRHESGELIGRVMNDAGELQHFLIDGMPYFLVNLLSFVSIAAILLSLSWRLALLVFLPVPILVLGGSGFWRLLRPMFHKHGNRIGRLHTLLGESIRGVRAVKSLVQEKRRDTDFDRANEQLFDVHVRLERTFHGFFGTMSVMMALGTVLVWYAGGGAIIEGTTGIGLGTLLAFVGYMALFYGPLQWFSAVLNWATNALTAAERIFAVIDQPEEGASFGPTHSVAKVRGAIRFERVRFSYERGKEVIRGIDLEVAPGQMIGLVGKSGAGKSTIINLIARFHDPDSGAVVVDGVDLREVDLASWRRQVGMVLQSPFLFNASILENIRYGAPDAPFERVVAAARAARAHDFISSKEDGYDTSVGDGGSSLSGGEAQRVAIARAILNDPPVLILDEATSAVDSETEKQIQEAIANLVKGRTTIAIAHRLATLRNADRLIVIDDGKIVEQGTHEELLAIEDGVFANLVKLQTDINRLRAEQTVWQE
ncbi:MAG TPA: ATP-binding cassette domain-containing protein [Longimicrobiales bacterium]|jgi:ATP-binding cassette subfamily B protein